MDFRLAKWGFLLFLILGPGLSKAAIGSPAILRSKMASQSQTSRAAKASFMPDFSQDFLGQYIRELWLVSGDQMSEGNQSLGPWVPNGGLISPVPEECLTETLDKTLQQRRVQASEYARLVQDYFKRCGSLLNAQARTGLSGLLDFADASYPFLGNSRIRAHQFKTKDGQILNGFIGVQDGAPRPWVIYKCGVYCGADPNAVTMKNFVIHFFDQAPFNVILLGNRTGQDYIMENKVFNFGGYFEYQDFIDIGRWLREESEYKDIVSSVHIVGVSLAASAAYLTENQLSLMDGGGDIHDDSHLFQSVSSICGVSDLRPTVKDMFASTSKGRIFSYFTWQKLKEAKAVLRRGSELIGDKQPQSSDFPILLGKLASQYVSSPGSDEEKEKEFWDQSHYSDKKVPVKIPLFVWASEDDSVVDFQINTGHLKSINAKNPDPNLGLVSLAQGEHCAFATSYGYSVASSVLRGFILNNSPEFLIETTKIPVEKTAVPPPLKSGEIINGLWWTQDSDHSNEIVLKIQIYKANSIFCPERWTYSGLENCQRIETLVFSKDFLEKRGFRKPLNSIDREALVRELNSRTSANYDGKSIVGSKHWPSEIWVNY